MVRKVVVSPDCVWWHVRVSQQLPMLAVGVRRSQNAFVDIYVEVDP